MSKQTPTQPVTTGKEFYESADKVITMSKKKTSEFTKLMIRAMVTRVQLQMKEQPDLIGHKHIGEEVERVEMTKEQMEKALDALSKLPAPTMTDTAKIMLKDLKKKLKEKINE
jgi:hypothetical protein